MNETILSINFPNLDDLGRGNYSASADFSFQLILYRSLLFLFTKNILLRPEMLYDQNK